MQRSDKVYIIILNYNSWQDTIECLESVLRNDYNNYQVIVVDNNSTDDSLENLLRWVRGTQSNWVNPGNPLRDYSCPAVDKPLEHIVCSDDIDKSDEELGLDHSSDCINSWPIVFIRAEKNGGFAAGNNIGIKYALKKGDFAFIWLVNNDTVIKRDALSNLVCYAKNYFFDLTGSALMYYQFPHKVQALGGHVNRFSAATSHILVPGEINAGLDYIIGASLLVTEKVIRNNGLLPEDYFLYYEEVDYCFSAKKRGFKLGVCLDSIVYHKVWGSQHGPDRYERMLNLVLKNRIKFHRKYLGGGGFLWLGLLKPLIGKVLRGRFLEVLRFIKQELQSKRLS
ncbi:MAG: glycosyltransferase family 2 protein [Candidatus Riflebacteria bacterium HGW-Riflebacteria-1]|nr:MAG: glycosyltransferase family 2 protein [Candidatus Riflebacteria bacterium HGW-Riflebacteria-1]